MHHHLYNQTHFIGLHLCLKAWFQKSLEKEFLFLEVVLWFVSVYVVPPKRGTYVPEYVIKVEFQKSM